VTEVNFSALEAARAREDFPALRRCDFGLSTAFFDSPGGTQVPRAVIDAIADGYQRCNVNVGGAFRSSHEVVAELADARAGVADLLNAANPDCISFGANMTSLNFALSHAVARSLRPGDEVVVTALDHEANRGPWLKLAEHGVVVKEVPLMADGSLDMARFEALMSTRTRLVACTLASNALGTVPDFALVRRLCDHYRALLVADAVHYAAHFPVDVAALDCDFLLCSAYKFYGPHIGILYSRPGLLDTLDTDCLRTQKQTAPYRIETGTLNHPALMGVTAAVDYLASWGNGATRRARVISAMRAIGEYEHRLAHRYAKSLGTVPGLQRWGPDFDMSPRAPTLSFTLAGIPAEQIAKFLGQRGIQVWHGHFYALRVLEAYNLVATGGLLRTGFALYNTEEEVERLVAGIHECLDRVKPLTR
jgi:cysteine desulfurase family protein (TIGR01976 family)